MACNLAASEFNTFSELLVKIQVEFRACDWLDAQHTLPGRPIGRTMNSIGLLTHWMSHCLILSENQDVTFPVHLRILVPSVRWVQKRKQDSLALQLKNDLRNNRQTTYMCQSSVYVTTRILISLGVMPVKSAYLRLRKTSSGLKCIHTVNG